MKAVQTLPEGYALLRTVDLQKDKKTALAVNLAGLVIMAVMAAGGAFLVPIGALFDFSAGFGMYILRFAVLLVGMVVYIILHEWTHGLVMRACGARRLRFGFTGLYAFAGSEEDYFPRGAYLCIALAPLAVWGVIFGILCAAVPREWFWVMYFLQITNVSGAVGDMYVSLSFSRLPREILIRDSGVRMEIYAPHGRR